VLRALSVSAGGNSTCAVMTDHTLYCWGDNTNSKLGLGDLAPRTTPTLVAGISDVASVSVGGYGTCAINTSGQLYCWGSSDMMPFTTVGSAPRPTAVAGSSPMSAVSMGTLHGCALATSGNVGCFGSNLHDETGSVGWHGAPNVHVVAGVLGLAPAAAVVAGSTYSCAAQRDGQVLCWGQGTFGQLGSSTADAVLTPTPVTNQHGPYVRLVSGNLTTLAVTNTGRVDCWGYSALGGCGVVSSSPSWTSLVTIAGFDGTGGVAATQGSTFAWGASGSVSCTGSKLTGQCGDGVSTGYGATITSVSALSAPVPSIDGGQAHTCAVDATGVVWCWGSNSAGQLGNGTMTDATTPVRVSGF
jgi:alpha-tubulin suppressor-like RCC1 family protein